VDGEDGCHDKYCGSQFGILRFVELWMPRVNWVLAQLLTGGISGLETLPEGHLRHICADGCGLTSFQPQARASQVPCSRVMVKFRIEKVASKDIPSR